MRDDTLRELKKTPQWHAAEMRYWWTLKKLLKFFEAQ